MFSSYNKRDFTHLIKIVFLNTSVFSKKTLSGPTSITNKNYFNDPVTLLCSVMDQSIYDLLIPELFLIPEVFLRILSPVFSIGVEKI